MHTSAFFKLFPPPRYLAMRFAGLDISDDAIRMIEFAPSSHGLTIAKHAMSELPQGLVEGGDIRDEKKLSELLSQFDRANDLSYVSVSVPEEKAYLFQTDVLGDDLRSIEQNIESKLEENVPLPASESIFYFDLLPQLPGGPLRASVSVVPRVYIERAMELLRGCGIVPVAFEVVPKSIARAVVPPHAEHAVLLVSMMRRKTGIYIVAGGVVCFTSTVGWGSDSAEDAAGLPGLLAELIKTCQYWASHNMANAPLGEIVLVGSAAVAYEDRIRAAMAETKLPVRVADVWRNAFDVNRYVPPISRDESLEYAVAAGLAMDSQ